MVDNLRIAGPKTLTSADSDISNDFALPASDSTTWCTDTSKECHDQPLMLLSDNDDFGAYYNWFTATAGSGGYDTKSDTKASYSICPLNWRLPIGGSSSSEFNDLYILYDLPTKWLDIPLDFVRSGRKNGANVDEVNISGYYWSSVARSNGVSYNLALAASVVRPLNNNFKYYGEPVRCLAK